MNFGMPSGCYQPVSIKEAEKIHKASMYIFEKVGFELENERALNLFAEHGGLVDFTAKRVKLKEEWIMEHVKKAPARIILHGREEKHDLVVEPGRVFLGTGGTAVGVMDIGSGLRRHTILKDVKTIAMLCHVLDLGSFLLFAWPSASSDNLCSNLAFSS
ncbi:MAG: trimethylamine methyltransferase family protein [Bacillota bacterium]